MTENINEIIAEFDANYEPSPDFTIELFEKHAAFLNNLKTFTNKEELGQFIQLTCKYVEAYYNKGYFNKAINLIDGYQAIIDEEIKKQNSLGAKDRWYYSLSFEKEWQPLN